MAEVTSELIYDVLKNIQCRIGGLEDSVREIKAELTSIRGHMLSMQTDVHNIYSKLDRHDEQLGRIERRLELRELAETPAPYEP